MSNSIKTIDAIGPAPRWIVTDLSSLPLTISGRVVGLKALAGDGTITVTDGTGVTGQPLALVEGAREDVEIQAITATDGGVTSLRIYLARP